MKTYEFETLMKLKKHFDKNNIELPGKGEYSTFDLQSYTTRDKFLLDIDRRGKIELFKYKIQHRYARTKVPLIRIEINCPPHFNPDGYKTSRNHIHIYKETDDDTRNLPWAYDLETFSKIPFDPKNLNFINTFYDFCEYCNIDTSNIQGVI